MTMLSREQVETMSEHIKQTLEHPSDLEQVDELLHHDTALRAQVEVLRKESLHFDRELAKAIEIDEAETAQLRAQLATVTQERDKLLKCAYIGPVRDCPTHGESSELKLLKQQLAQRDARIQALETAVKSEGVEWSIASGAHRLCPWCNGYKTNGHFQTCVRQRALAQEETT